MLSLADDRVPPGTIVGPFDEFFPPGRIEVILRALDRGEIIAVPTETVYGLCVSEGAPGGEKRLAELKKRPEEKLFTRFVSSAKRFEELCPGISLPVKKVARKLWPGPLTIVAETGKMSLGFRVPDEKSVLRILGEYRTPLLSTSANVSGEPALRDAKEIQAKFGSELAVILASKKPCGEKASTVAKLGSSGFEILREGAVSERDIRIASGVSVLFVCTGNLCRSPAAEIMFRDLLRKNAEKDGRVPYDVSVMSAGTYAPTGIPIPEPGVQALNLLGYLDTSHFSKHAAAIPLKVFDVIFAMERSHRDALLSIDPSVAGRIRLLDPGSDVPDPIGGTVDDFLESYKQIQTLVSRAAASL
ncbi:MAG: Sua5/YciO/YrdC/YwlC family protein [Planctomycetes bacterium]|nr:Sua5/YciO/YrdC/YwlC family protein [Planctomycetota bacterium]